LTYTPFPFDYFDKNPPHTRDLLFRLQIAVILMSFLYFIFEFIDFLIGDNIEADEEFRKFVRARKKFNPFSCSSWTSFVGTVNFLPSLVRVTFCLVVWGIMFTFHSLVWPLELFLSTSYMACKEIIHSIHFVSWITDLIPPFHWGVVINSRLVNQNIFGTSIYEITSVIPREYMKFKMFLFKAGDFNLFDNVCNVLVAAVAILEYTIYLRFNKLFADFTFNTDARYLDFSTDEFLSTHRLFSFRNNILGALVLFAFAKLIKSISGMPTDFALYMQSMLFVFSDQNVLMFIVFFLLVVSAIGFASVTAFHFKISAVSSPRISWLSSFTSMMGMSTNTGRIPSLFVCIQFPNLP
jgi:hypothetical protein